MADKLQIYNHALLEANERSLNSLSDAGGGEALRLLNRHWDRTVNRILESTGWNFALRTLKVEKDPDVTTSFGFRNAFTKPSDIIRTDCLSIDEYFRETRFDYREETGYWYSDFDPIYVRYVSNGVMFGWNIGVWPQYFADAVGLSLAAAVANKLSSDTRLKEGLEKKAKKAALDAQAMDAAQQPQDRLRYSGWVRSRSRGAGFGADGGMRR